MEQIKFYIAIVVAFFCIVGLALALIASVVALFKIDEADEYYGVGRLGGERLYLKGLPFSMGRMAEYGMVVLFSRTRYVQNRYGRELEQIAANTPPRDWSGCWYGSTPPGSCVGWCFSFSVD